LKAFAQATEAVGADETFPRGRVLAASWLVGKSVLYLSIWRFARKWEQEKTDQEQEKTDQLGDNSVARLIGLECAVQLEQYQMGTLKVQQGPSISAFSNFAGVVNHGHAACRDLRLEPTADTKTLEWRLGHNVFVGAEGQDLNHFAGAVKYWETTGNFVYVFYQVLHTEKSQRTETEKRKKRETKEREKKEKRERKEREKREKQERKEKQSQLNTT
jgi:hypothetical protein